MLVRVYHETSVFSSSLHRQLKYDFGLLFHLFFSYFSLLCIKRFFLFFFVFCVFLCSFLRFFHLFFCNIFSSTHTHRVIKNFSTTQSLQNTKMASSLTFSASVGQQQKVFSAKHASGSKKRVSVQTKAASFVRFFCYSVLSFFYVCV